MNSEIHTSGSERFLDFLREHSLGANHRQGDVGNLVAGSVDDLNLDLVAAFAQERGYVVGLP
jgi:hypothetical protein